MIVAILSLLPGLAPSANPLPESTSREPAFEAPFSETYDDLLSAYEKAALNWRRARRAARKAKEAFEEPNPIDAWFERFRALAEAGDGQAVQWIALNAEDTKLPKDEVGRIKRAAIGRLTTEFVSETYLSELVRVATKQDAWFGHAEIADILAAVFDGNQDDGVRVNAAYKLARHLEDGSEHDASAAAERWYRTIIEEFPDAKLAQRAKNRLESMKIGIGKIAPDFEAEDVDGNPFKLSDYRGKVVVLDFWGFW